MKNVINVFLSILIIGSCFSCNNPEKKKVYLLLKTLNNPFFSEMQRGVEKQIGNKYTIIVKAGTRESDIESQIQALQTVYERASSSSESIAGVLITPTSSKNELLPYLKQLREKNIPIIIIDTKIDSILLRNEKLDDLPFVASSNLQGGKQAADLILQNISANSEILILNGVEGQETATDRNKGFHSVIDTSNKKLVVTERTANWNRQEALMIVSGLYSSGKRYEAIFAANDEMALGSLQAILNENVSPIPIIVGFDATTEAREAVKNKKLTATIAQNPEKMGEISVDMLNSLIENKHVDKVYLIPTEVVN